MDRYHGDECKEQCPGYVELSEGAFDCNGYGDCELNKSTNKWECDCDDYASGKGCEIVCPVSNNDAGDILVCSDHGACNSALGTCSCLPGYYGEDCSLSCPGLLSATNDTATECSGHGSCLDIGATKVECECNAGFYGPACDQSCPGLVELSGVAYACSGHGTCDNGICRCDPFFYGPACDQSCPGLVEIDGKQQECSGHGTCNAEILQCECSSPNYVGAACAINPPLSPRHLRELHVSPRPLFGFPDLHLRRGVSFSFFFSHPGTTASSAACGASSRAAAAATDSAASGRFSSLLPSDGACTCLWGFSGARCDQPCSRDTCGGHGECVAKGRLQAWSKLLSRRLRVRRGLPGGSLRADATTAAEEDADDAAGAGAAGSGLRTAGGVAATECGDEGALRA